MTQCIGSRREGGDWGNWPLDKDFDHLVYKNQDLLVIEMTVQHVHIMWVPPIVYAYPCPLVAMAMLQHLFQKYKMCKTATFDSAC